MFNPDEPRDEKGRWTDAGPAIQAAASDGNINSNFINKEYATEQEFREAAQKLIDEGKAANLKTDGSGSADTGRSGGEGEISESEKKQLRNTVDGYYKEHGDEFNLPEPVPTKVVLDENRSREISGSYDRMKSDPGDPRVKAAYRQLATEVDAQYDYMTNKLGIKTAFSENDPYRDSKEMALDVVKNKNLKVYKGGDDHPLLGKITMDKNGLTANEKFRAVHDYFGHAIEQNQFGKLGEERAWVAHSKMFSPLAQSAMTTETRGQNSWVNFSGANTGSLFKMTEGNRMIKSGDKEAGQRLVAEGQKEFKFAEQKVGLLPDQYFDWKVYASKPGISIKN